MDVEQRAALDEFLSLVDRSGECHIWMGARMARDYGFFKKRLATHWALEFAGFGRPSSSHGALHSCDNPCCVNPEHLKWGTQKENAADASQRMRYPNSRKTHCPKGHEYTAQNTIHRARKQGWKDRHCRECDMIRKREYRARSAMLAARPEVKP